MRLLKRNASANQNQVWFTELSEEFWMETAQNRRKIKGKKKKAQFYHLQFDAAETIGNLLKILRERQQLKMPLWT